MKNREKEQIHDPTKEITINYTGIKNEYPFIFLHGLFGWGEDSPTEQWFPYWGSSKKADLMTYLREKGHMIFYPSVSSLSSNWDRCCELYAQLTGTRVDYGEAHSKKYQHARYGRDYSGRAIMGKDWDLKSKINILGYSLGGPSARLFASLLADGDEEERRTSGENVSELFKGGHPDLINSIICLCAPHNGTVIANVLTYYKGPVTVLLLFFNFLSAIGFKYCDSMLDQWGISKDPAKGKRARMSLKNCRHAVEMNEHSGTDISIGGAIKLNKRITNVKDTYYFSICTRGTYPDYKGKLKKIKTMMPVLYPAIPVFRMAEGKTVDGVKLDKTWTPSDGIVPTVSELYPNTEENNHALYRETKTFIRGKWYVMPCVEQHDHLDFCRANGGFRTPANYFNFFEKLIDMIDNLP